MNWDMALLSTALPEDVERAIWAGDYEFAFRRMDRLLEGELPARLRDRIILEKTRLAGLDRQFPYGRDEAIAKMRELVPDFTAEDLDRLDLDGATSFAYRGGEKRYLRSFHRTLVKVNPEMRARAGIRADAGDLSTIRLLKENGFLSYKFRVRQSLMIDDSAFEKGVVYRVHLPVPQTCEQTSDVSVLSSSHPIDHLAPDSAPQRTAFFERALDVNAPFWVEYEYVRTAKYWRMGDRARVYDYIAPPTADDLAELPPHIPFTPYIRALAAELGAGKTKENAARAFYDYITQNVVYSYMRDYLNIDSGAEFTLLGRKADCGLQALAFIALCRVSGIPARWQSGLWADNTGIGNHDWAQFYLEGPGWLFCDPSYGGGAHRAGNEERRDFYFGNLDPFRMSANRAYMAPFDPPKRYLRCDPFDNQDGEVETDARGLTSAEFDTDRRVLLCERIG